MFFSLKESEIVYDTHNTNEHEAQWDLFKTLKDINDVMHRYPSLKYGSG